MGKPAARVGDMHVCPMVTPGVPPIPHVGGPILPPGVPTVLIGGMPAAVAGGMATCVGPPDSIVLGSMGVMIGGMPAARMGDTCAHGGTIVLGLPTVLIGEMSPGAPPMAFVAPGMVAGPGTGTSKDESEGESPQVKSMKAAASRGAPFCEMCARQSAGETAAAAATAAESTADWVEFELVDDDSKPVVGEKYRLELPDGSVREGVTDIRGKVRLEGLSPGTCKITFPNFGGEA